MLYTRITHVQSTAQTNHQLASRLYADAHFMFTCTYYRVMYTCAGLFRCYSTNLYRYLSNGQHPNITSISPYHSYFNHYNQFSSFHYRKRWYGFITSLGSIYVFFIINNYVREQSWNKEDTPGIGGTIIFVSSIFLIAISFLYSIRPGKKPQHVFWWRPEPKSNRLIRLSAVVFGSGIICTQNNLPIIGYGLAFTRFAIAYYAHKLKWME